MFDWSPFRFLLFIALFVGHVLLLGPIFDRGRSRADRITISNPDLASLNAELLAIRLGIIVLTAIQATAWLSGLVVTALIFLFVYSGSWIALPASVAINAGFAAKILFNPCRC